MPRAAWRDIVVRTFKRTWDDNVGLVSAGVAFYGFFALFSLLGLMVLVYGFAADPHTVIDDVHTITAVLPVDIAKLIGTQLMTSVEASQSAKGFAAVLAAVVAIYGGSNGAASVITALNIAYEEKEKRGLLHFYFLAIGMTLSALVLGLCALAATAAIAFLQRFVPPEVSLLSVIAGKVGGYLLLTLLAMGVAATLYRYGPSRENAKWRWITPGSTFTAIAWLLLTFAFGFYLGHLTNYKVTYGSLAAVVALLSWMYLCAYAFVFGAELDSEIEHQTAIDSTTGSPEPMGERGAWAADNVATDDTVQDRPEEQREGEKLTEAQPKVADEKD